MYVDWLENEVRVGDYIFFSTVIKGAPCKYVGKILEFVDDRYPKVQVVKLEYSRIVQGPMIVSNVFVKVDYKES